MGVAIVVEDVGSEIKTALRSTLRPPRARSCDTTHHARLAPHGRHWSRGGRDLRGRSRGMVASPKPKLASQRLKRDRSSGSSGEAVPSAAGGGSSATGSAGAVSGPGEAECLMPVSPAKVCTSRALPAVQPSRMTPQIGGANPGLCNSANPIADNMLVCRVGPGPGPGRQARRCWRATDSAARLPQDPDMQAVAFRHPCCGAAPAVRRRSGRRGIV